MSTKTKNYQFVKPEENEFYDISIPNANWDIADAELKRRVPEDGDISGTQVSTLGTITEEFPIPAAGDTTKTIVGKIKKFFEDFKNLKSSLLLVNQVVNNCTTNRGDLPGAAAQLKVLMDLYTKLNSDLTLGMAGKAPTSHASTGTGYGVGGASNYGHVKVSDNYASSAGAASAGVAASSLAVYNVYSALAARLALTGGTLTGILYTRAILPTADASYDIGSSSAKYSNIYGNYIRAYGAVHSQGLFSIDTTNEMRIESSGGISIKNNGNTAYRPIYASAFNTSSSRRYKSDIEDITEAEANKILEIVPRKFCYVNTTEVRYGMIAEEMEEIQGQGISYDADGLPNAIDYSSLVPQMIKLIQLQEQRIKDLEAAILLK